MFSAHTSRSPRAPTTRGGGWRLALVLVALGISVNPMALGREASALQAATAPPAFGDADVVAHYADSSITWSDLDSLMKARRAMARDGRAALKHMMESKALEVLARENGIEVSEAQVDARWNELESQIRASGDTGGIAGYLRKGHLDPAEFRRYLRLSIVQETLTRRALGLNDKAPLSGEQQEIWIEERLRERKYTENQPPWTDGLAATCVGFSVGIDELVRGLRQRLPEQEVREDCYQVLLYHRMQKRLPDLAPAKLDEYVKKEVERRKYEITSDPRYKGIPYEKVLGAQGIMAESLATDPAVLVAALSRAWVDRAYPPEALKRVYSDEREYFDGLYGEAIDVSMLFLRGAQFKNEYNPRTFAEAEAKLLQWKPGLHSLEEFQRVAKTESEDAATKESGGSLGYVTPGNPRVPSEIKAELVKALNSKPPNDSTGKNLVGPLRLPNGCVLLWLGLRRPAQSWDAMAAQVHRELRKRFIDEVLPKASVVTVFDGQ